MIMFIYRLEINIDGYGGHLKDQYFFDFNKAKEAILNQSAITYLSEDDKWIVDGMKECNVFEEDNSFSLVGVAFPKEEQDPWCIRYCFIYIKPIELDFDLSYNSIWILKYITGYVHWLNHFNDYSDNISYDEDHQPTIVGYYKSRKKARKAAKKKPWKSYPRLWIKQEDEEKISPLGKGMNYLSIEKIDIE